MAEMLGFFEVDEEKGFVRIKHSENSYDYLVSDEKYGSNARAAASLFFKAYHYGVLQTQNELKKVIGLK